MLAPCTARSSTGTSGGECAWRGNADRAIVDRRSERVVTRVKRGVGTGCDTRTSLNGDMESSAAPFPPSRYLTQPRCLYEKLRNVMLYDTITDNPGQNGQDAQPPHEESAVSLDLVGTPCPIQLAIRSARAQSTLRRSSFGRRNCDARKGTSVDSLCVLP